MSLLHILLVLLAINKPIQDLKEKEPRVIYTNASFRQVFSDMNLNQNDSYSNFLTSKALYAGFYKNNSLGISSNMTRTNSDYFQNNSIGLQYSYLFFLENNSFFSFGLFIGNGNAKVNRFLNSEYGNNRFTNAAYYLEKNLLNIYLISKYSSNQIYNFIDFSPSISFNYPINSQYLQYIHFDLFYSYKTFSNKNKFFLIDDNYSHTNEFGFSVGISRLN
jgi:hypothetical protein